MKKLTKYFNKGWFAFFVNLVILLFCIVFFDCRFETVDDYMMKMISSGAYGLPDNHLFFINSFFGSGLQALYSWNGSISWYELVQYLIILISLSIITYIMLNHSRKNRSVIALFMMFLFLCSFNMYVKLQFTKTATIATISGYMLLAFLVDHKHSGVFGYISSIFLIAIGFLLRLQQFLAVSFICIAFFIPVIVQFFIEPKNTENTDKLKKIIMTGLFCAIFLVLSIIIDKRSYSADNWQFYATYQASRSDLLDGGFPYYSENKEMYINLRISQEDVAMYQVWNFDDPDKFDINVMNTIINAKEPDKITIFFIYDFAINTIKFFISDLEHFLYFLFLLIATVLFLFQKHFDLKVLLFLILSFLICEFYCYYIRAEHLLISRVVISFVYTCIFIELYYADSEPKRNLWKWNVCFLCVIAILSLAYVINESKDLKTRRYLQEKNYTALCEISSDKDHLYMITEYNQVSFINILFDTEAQRHYDNVLSLGGWLTNCPLRDRIKEKYSIRNPYIDLINNEQAYFLARKDSSDLDKTLNYIRRNYFDSVEAIPVENAILNKEGYELYMFRME